MLSLGMVRCLRLGMMRDSGLAVVLFSRLYEMYITILMT